MLAGVAVDLSILICSLRRRRAYLERLHAVLLPQIEASNGRVEALVEMDRERDGDVPIGEKRNSLVARAAGRYIAFVDDDDLVDPEYVSLILAAIESGPDVVGMSGIMTNMQQKEPKPQLFHHSLEYGDWYEKSGVFYRYPNHLNPVKIEHARATKFLPLSFGEDRDYSRRLLGLLKTEVRINKPIYFYEFRPRKEA